MYKLPGFPSPKAATHEIADFAEVLSWDRGLASKREIVADLGRGDENANNIGCDDDDDENSEFLDEVMNEIERRASACGSGYPFRLDLEGTVLRHDADRDDHRAVVYRYLLLSTRLDMVDNRVHAGVDGAALLEEVAAHALKNYLGGGRTHARVFGTAAPGGFQDKVDALCRELREGTGFRSPDDAHTHAKDDKLDAVAWVPFSDSFPGQLIVFAQCKTGTNWRDTVTQLQPDAFIKKWMKDPVLVDPIRAFCISEAADRSRWKEMCTEAGILLDRCRLVDFCDNLAPDLLDRVSRWTTVAKETVTH
ncbi:MAG: hypothetical protein HY710_16635 [Candidatus Latescibacteria bacterium]|nr:hypothetical protein [Candidatus Latescibacterota bacterium]